MERKNIRKKIRQTITYMCLSLLLPGLLGGCGGSADSGDSALYFHHSMKQDGTQTTEAAEEMTDTQTEGQELFLIVENNQVEESLRLYRYANGMEYRYYYGTGTRFHDKYGNRTSVMNFVTGMVITIGDVDEEGILRQADLSDEVWVYNDIQRFSIDEERHIFEIADTRYTYDDITTYFFSNEERVMVGDVAQGDTLAVVGMGKDILSVRITTGQGVLALENTELFEGSYLQLGTKIFAEITPDMQLSVEEGTYKLIVAHNGWGGSREVTITRDATTVVDLDELKGDGPKSGNIQFVVDVADAVLMIDGEKMDYTKPLKLTYGVHALAVYASGYDEWERNLYVNSSEATIVIQLKDADKDASDTVKTDDSKEDDKDDKEDKDSKKEEDDEKKDSYKDDLERMEDEMELIRDLLTSTVI